MKSHRNTPHCIVLIFEDIGEEWIYEASHLLLPIELVLGSFASVAFKVVGGTYAIGLGLGRIDGMSSPVWFWSRMGDDYDLMVQTCLTI